MYVVCECVCVCGVCVYLWGVQWCVSYAVCVAVCRMSVSMVCMFVVCMYTYMWGGFNQAAYDLHGCMSLCLHRPLSPLKKALHIILFYDYIACMHAESLQSCPTL